MADQQFLDLLLQGVDHWNAWRSTHPDVRPDLTFADFREANLMRANLSETDLREANFSKAQLSRADLSLADLSRADLRETDLSHTDLSRAILREANFDRADLRKADLTGADFFQASLFQAKLCNAQLTLANLSFANLSFADLNTADLSLVDLVGTNLHKTDLSQALIGTTIFADVDLRTVVGLETVKHEAPSSIGTDTLLRSAGDIPEIFLRGAGLTEALITYVHSLINTPIEYYTCFISYSSKDQDFAERLHADLQSKGVRCWFAPEDLKIGDKFWHRIDESIRLYDKLLVVLSLHSVNSAWVEREVMAALEKEQQQNKTVLFPIKLDESVMQTSLPWAADIRRSRHIGDFIHWKDHDSYQSVFARLLRDLQASAQQKP